MKKKYKELCATIIQAVDWYRIGDDEQLDEIFKLLVCKVAKLAEMVKELIKDKDKT